MFLHHHLVKLRVLKTLNQLKNTITKNIYLLWLGLKREVLLWCAWQLCWAYFYTWKFSTSSIVLREKLIWQKKSIDVTDFKICQTISQIISVSREPKNLGFDWLVILNTENARVCDELFTVTMLGWSSFMRSDTSSGTRPSSSSSIQQSFSTFFFLMNFTTTWVKSFKFYNTVSQIKNQSKAEISIGSSYWVVVLLEG